jgi:hypothetical protein
LAASDLRATFAGARPFTAVLRLVAVVLALAFGDLAPDFDDFFMA